MGPIRELTSLCTRELQVVILPQYQSLICTKSSSSFQSKQAKDEVIRGSRRIIVNNSEEEKEDNDNRQKMLLWRAV